MLLNPSRWVVAALLLVSFVNNALAFDKPPFPRLGGYKIGSPQAYDDPKVQADYAKLNMVVITNFPGWESYHHTTMSAVINGIKSHNSETLVFGYLMPDAVVINSAWTDLTHKLDAQHWWLYPAGGTGAPVAPTSNSQMVNYTMATPPDANGDRYVDFFSKWFYNTLYKNAPFDGTFTDNMFWRPRINGDWDRDGVIDSKGSEKAGNLTRDGLKHHILVMRQLMPGKYQLGNVADWGQQNAVYPQYEQLLNGGVLETIIGKPYSPEGLDNTGKVNSWGSWSEMMRWYRKTMASLAEPKLAIFNQIGDPKDYQNFRYGFASCLMDDAYFDYSDSVTKSAAYSSVVWFDEYDNKLGNAVAGPSLTAWQKGVYRRDFENGIVLVNPRGNGDVDVTLEDDFRHIKGTQDPSVNDGSLTRTIHLKDRDGVILLRKSALKVPRPPTSVRVTPN